MSQDASSKPNNPQEIDLDDLEVEVLIIAKNANGMTQAANFLSRRGWPTTVLSNVGKAIEHISDKQPDFILISFNHTHPAVLKLPDLITRTFNLTVVGYAEVLDSVTTARLSNFRMQHKLQGQPSGPSIQRAIRKILSDKFHFKNSDDAESSEEASSRDQSELIQGGTSKSQSGSGLIYQKGNAGTQANHTAVSSGTAPTSGSSSASSESVPSLSASEEAEVISSGKYTMKNKKARLSLKKATGMDEIAKDAVADASLMLSQALAQDGANLSDSDENGLGIFSPANEEPKNTGRGPSLQEALEEAERKPQGAPVRSSPAALPEQGGPEKSDAMILGTGGQTKKSSAATSAEEDVTSSSGVKSLMHSTVEAALQSVCVPSSGTLPIIKIERVCVFPVESEAEPGYLVVAWNGEEYQDTFLKECESALKKAFTENGVQGQVESGFWVTVPDVKFWKWVNAKAKFFFALSHHGHQVGASFFASPSPLPKVRELEETGMYAIDLDHIATDAPVNFKAYLHMRKNKKHFLYLRDGRQLQPEQKKRLKTNQVTDLSLKSVDVEKVRMFLAASYLRETIKGSGEDAA